MIGLNVHSDEWIPYNQRRQIEKKILPEYYKEIKAHRKMFEIRKDEDGIQVGDILVLREWDGEKYTGERTRREVTYILRNAPQYGLMDGYCILSLQVPGWDFSPLATVDNVSASDNGIAIGALSGDLVIQKGENNKHIVNNGTITMTFDK